MRLYRIINKPITTEKTSLLEVNNWTYVFEVAPSATKIDVKKSVLELYGVEVASVNVLNTREKFKYWRKRWMQVKRRTAKKAYVTLKDKTAKIDFTQIK